MDETIKAIIVEECDKLLRASELYETFAGRIGLVDYDFDFPYVRYFDQAGNVVSVNYASKEITYVSAEEVEAIVPRTVPLQDIRDLLYALEGSALSSFAFMHNEREVQHSQTMIEGDNLLELFTNLLARHQDTSTRDHFQSEVKRLNGDTT